MMPIILLSLFQLFSNSEPFYYHVMTMVVITKPLGVDLGLNYVMYSGLSFV
jgi:hypothetical protein